MSGDAHVSFGAQTLDELRAAPGADDALASLETARDAGRPESSSKLDPTEEFRVGDQEAWAYTMVSSAEQVQTRATWIAGDRLAVLVMARPLRVRAVESGEQALRSELADVREVAQAIGQAQHP